jgi:hypothetical protein
VVRLQNKNAKYKKNPNNNNGVADFNEEKQASTLS